MAGLKDSFSKGITAINLKTNGYIEENKLKTYIVMFEREKNELLLKAGTDLCDGWKNGNTDINRIEGIFGEIQKKEDEREEQVIKLSGLAKNQEAILGKKTEEEEEKIYCTKFGTPNAANYRFCVKCGQPL